VLRLRATRRGHCPPGLGKPHDHAAGRLNSEILMSGSGYVGRNFVGALRQLHQHPRSGAMDGNGLAIARDIDVLVAEILTALAGKLETQGISLPPRVVTHVGCRPGADGLDASDGHGLPVGWHGALRHSPAARQDKTRKDCGLRRESHGVPPSRAYAPRPSTPFV